MNHDVVALPGLLISLDLIAVCVLDWRITAFGVMDVLAGNAQMAVLFSAPRAEDEDR